MGLRTHLKPRFGRSHPPNATAQLPCWKPSQLGQPQAKDDPARMKTWLCLARPRALFVTAFPLARAQRSSGVTPVDTKGRERRCGCGLGRCGRRAHLAGSAELLKSNTWRMSRRSEHLRLRYQALVDGQSSSSSSSRGSSQVAGQHTNCREGPLRTVRRKSSMVRSLSPGLSPAPHLLTGVTGWKSPGSTSGYFSEDDGAAFQWCLKTPGTA
uniref:Uncharacterized protein LOC110211078 n=1 Tax=Phascolarctos cinereus TaxID=38626 RepID=A0A6P5KJY2_PHACI|nr:uncharacterized protein LOC110211078 [Phascolarctos cinereus]